MRKHQWSWGLLGFSRYFWKMTPPMGHSGRPMMAQTASIVDSDWVNYLKKQFKKVEIFENQQKGICD